MQENTNRKKIYLLIGGCVVLVAFLVVLLIQMGAAQKLRLSEPFAANLGYPRQLTKDKVYFFTNTAFAIYDLQSKSTESLTPQYTLPNDISEVKIAKQGALMRAGGYSTLDQLYPELVKANLDPNLDYWWHVDFESDAISLIGSAANAHDVRGAAWQDDSNFVYVEKLADSTKLAIVSRSNTGTEKTLASISDEAILVGATPKNILYTEIESEVNYLKVLDISSNNAAIAVQNIAAVLATGPDGSALVVTSIHEDEAEETHDHELPHGSLVLYDNVSKKNRELTDDFRGNARWIPYNNTWGAIGRDRAGNSTGFTLTQEGRVTNFTIAEKKEDKTRRYNFVGTHGADILLADERLEVRLLGATQSTISLQQPSTKPLQEGITEPHFYLVYDPALNQYSIYILQNPYEANQTTVLTRIKDMGYDVNQLNIMWRPYDGVTPAFALPDSVVPTHELEPSLPFDPEVGD